MERAYRPDRDRRDRDSFRVDHRDRDRDRDYDRDRYERDSYRLPRRPSGFSDGPPPPRDEFSGGGPFQPPPPDHRRNPVGGPPPLRDRSRSPLRGYSSGRHPDDRRSSDAVVLEPRRDTGPPRGDYRPIPGNPPDDSWARRPVGGDFGGDFPPQRPPYHQLPPINHPSPPQLLGQKRGYPSPAIPAPSQEHIDGKTSVKVFVGSVPRTASEEEIRQLFDEQGKVLEVAMIKDKITGQQQGCCFIKYATLEEADRAIRALHNQYTLSGGVSPIQVRYADGERERFGNVEYKLYVGSVNKYATEKDVEEIFAPYGRIDDVYLLRDERKQSKGCGFVKYSNKDSAMAAVNALNGIYTMRGCDRPLMVRFADPKKPRPGEPRADSSFGGPGFGPSSMPGVRPGPGSNFPDNKSGQGPQNAWQPLSPQNMRPPPNTNTHGFGNGLPSRSGETPISYTPGGHTGAQGGITTGSLSTSSTSAQSFSQSLPQLPLSGQQISPVQKSLQPPQHFPPALHLHQGPGSYSQVPTSQSPMRPPSQLQTGSLPPFSRPFQSQVPSGQLPPAQYQAYQSMTAVATQPRPNTSSSLTNSQATTPAPQQTPYQQPPSQLAQMLSQQTQTLQASFESSQQTFSNLQQQYQIMRPSSQYQPPQESFQASKQQPQWKEDVPTAAANGPLVGPTRDAPPPSSLAKAATASCSWTEHTSPDGHKYYYNSTTGESRWIKPEELTLYEEQQQKSVGQQPQPQPQQNLQAIPTQQVTQSQPSQPQTKFHNAPSQHPSMFSFYSAAQAPGNQTSQVKTYAQSLPPANSVTDPTAFQQGFPAAQDWAWNNSRGN